MNPFQFWNALMGYCYAEGGSVTSYGRTQKHNQAVGGVPNSGHRYWVAADVVYDSPRPTEERLRVAQGLGLRVIIEDDHDHLQPFDWPKG
jgi:hypothetical protein